MPPLSRQSLTEQVENLKADFEFLINKAVSRDDMRGIEKALQEAFATVPPISQLPTWARQAKENQALAAKELDRFFDSLPD